MSKLVPPAPYLAYRRHVETCSVCAPYLGASSCPERQRLWEAWPVGLRAAPGPRLLNCACGCGEPLPEDGPHHQRFASATCRQRAKRARDTTPVTGDPIKAYTAHLVRCGGWDHAARRWVGCDACKSRDRCPVGKKLYHSSPKQWREWWDAHATATPRTKSVEYLRHVGVTIEQANQIAKDWDDENL